MVRLVWLCSPVSGTICIITVETRGWEVHCRYNLPYICPIVCLIAFFYNEPQKRNISTVARHTYVPVMWPFISLHFPFPLLFCLSSSGVIRTAVADLDRETQDRYELVVKATDMAGQMGGLSGSTTVTIVITDVNDNAPSFPQSGCTSDTAYLRSCVKLSMVSDVRIQLPERERERERASERDRRDWSLLIFTISALDNLWPKCCSNTNRPWRLTRSQAAPLSSDRAGTAPPTRWARTGDIQPSKLPEKSWHSPPRTEGRHGEREKESEGGREGALHLPWSLEHMQQLAFGWAVIGRKGVFGSMAYMWDQWQWLWEWRWLCSALLGGLLGHVTFRVVSSELLWWTIRPCYIQGRVLRASLVDY